MSMKSMQQNYFTQWHTRGKGQQKGGNWNRPRSIEGFLEQVWLTDALTILSIWLEAWFSAKRGHHSPSVWLFVNDHVRTRHLKQGRTFTSANLEGHGHVIHQGRRMWAKQKEFTSSEQAYEFSTYELGKRAAFIGCALVRRGNTSRQGLVGFGRSGPLERNEALTTKIHLISPHHNSHCTRSSHYMLWATED